MASNEFLKTFSRLTGGKWDAYTVWSDFIEMAAISISNSVDLVRRDEREKRYLDIAGKYTADELDIFAELFASLVIELEKDPRDVLGDAFMELELGNKWKGQFFTPYPVAEIMAKMTVHLDLVREHIAERGFLEAYEPCIGGGVTMIGLFNCLKESGINPQQYLVIEGGDIDSRACHMAYIQLSLLGANAIIRQRDGLASEDMPDEETWFSPFYILGAWAARRGLGGDMGRLMAGLMLEDEVGLSTTLETEGGQLGFDVSEVS